MSTSPTRTRKWASVRKKFNLIVAHRSSSPDRSSSPSSTLSAESQAASFCRPYTANPAFSTTSVTTSNIATTTLEAPPRSPRPVSSPVAFPVRFPPTSMPTPTPTPPPPPPQPAAAAENKKARQALLAGEGEVEIDPAEEALLAPTTAAEAEWDRLTKANSEMNNNLDLYGTAGEKSKSMRKRAKSRVGRRKKGVKFCEGEDIIGLGGFEVWTTDEESGGEEEETVVVREKERERREMVRKETGGEERRKRDMKVEVEVRAVEVKAPPRPPPPRPQSLPASTKRAPPVGPGSAMGHPIPKRPPPPEMGLSETREVSRKMLPPSVRLVQDDGSF